MLAGALWRKAIGNQLLAGALWRSCCWPGRRGGAPSGRCCWRGRRARDAAGRGAAAELLAGSAMAKRMAALWRRAIGNQLLAGVPCMEDNAAASGRACRSTEDDAAASGIQQAHTKREGPGRDLNISPEPLLFIALRKGNALAKLPLQLCRDCKEGCSKCKNCVELWEYGKDKGVTEYILSV